MFEAIGKIVVLVAAFGLLYLALYVAGLTYNTYLSRRWGWVVAGVVMTLGIAAGGFALGLTLLR